MLGTDENVQQRQQSRGQLNTELTTLHILSFFEMLQHPYFDDVNPIQQFTNINQGLWTKYLFSWDNLRYG